MLRTLTVVAATTLVAAPPVYGQSRAIPPAPTLPAPMPYTYHNAEIGAGAAKLRDTFESALEEQRLQSRLLNEGIKAADGAASKNALVREAEVAARIANMNLAIGDFLAGLNRRQADDSDRRHAEEVVDYIRLNQPISTRMIASDVRTYLQ